MLEAKLMDLCIAFGCVGLGGWLLTMMVKKYFEQKYNADFNLQQQKIQSESQAQTLNIRLQAYERLLIFCERVALPNLVARLRTDGATTNDLRLAMLIAIQQEFEHNVTQQIYVSEKLWSIVEMARNNTAEIINITAQKVAPDAPATDFIRALGEFLNQNQDNSLAVAQNAVRQEAANLVGVK